MFTSCLEFTILVPLVDPSVPQHKDDNGKWRPRERESVRDSGPQIHHTEIERHLGFDQEKVPVGAPGQWPAHFHVETLDPGSVCTWSHHPLEPGTSFQHSDDLRRIRTRGPSALVDPLPGLWHLIEKWLPNQIQQQKRTSNCNPWLDNHVSGTSDYHKGGEQILVAKSHLYQRWKKVNMI